MDFLIWAATALLFSYFVFGLVMGVIGLAVKRGEIWGPGQPFLWNVVLALYLIGYITLTWGGNILEGVLLHAQASASEDPS